MSAKIIDGKAVSKRIRENLRGEIDALREKGVTPKLSVVLAGDDPASRTYVGMKNKACGKLGMESVQIYLPGNVTEAKLLSRLRDLNDDDSVHGILVQLPLPSHIDQLKVLSAVDPAKDVDGFHPSNVGRLLIGDPLFVPCTPLGICVLLHESGIEIEGRDVVIVGRSTIVGRPLMALLMQKKKGYNATVTICHTGTADMAKHTRGAEILIVAAGRPETVTAGMVSEGAVVVDVGVNRVEDPSSPKGYRLVGDVDFEDVREVASAITPVPGGVGPMTIAMLMQNTVKAAKMACGRPLNFQ